MLRVSLLLLAATLLLLGCSSDKGFGESEDVNRDDYGSSWPLTVESAVLTCSPEGDLSATIDGYTVGIEDVSESNADRALLRSWATDEGGKRVDLSPLVEDARDLC